MATRALGLEAGLERAPRRAHSKSAARRKDATVAHASTRRVVKAAVAALLVVVVGVGIAAFARTDHALVRASSMYPQITPGSLVFIRKAPRYHVGQVLQVRVGARLELERLNAIEQVGTYVLAADRPAGLPDVLTPEAARREVLGAVVRSVPYLGMGQLFLEDPSYALSWLRAELGTWGKLALNAAAALLAGVLAFGRHRRARRSVRMRAAHVRSPSG